MTGRIEVKTMQEAWEKVSSIFPTDYEEDVVSRERAGYPIYRSTVEYYDYICDLGDRLEINLKSGKTINIWIVVEEKEQLPELPKKEDIKAAASNQFTFEPETVQLVRAFVDGGKYENEAKQRVYKAMKKVEGDRFWLFNIAGDVIDAYCGDKGIEWGTIKVISVTHYEHGKSEDYGHFVIEAIITKRVKE